MFGPNETALDNLDVLFIEDDPRRLNLLQEVRQAIEQPGLPSIVLAPSNAIELERRDLGPSAPDYPVRAPYQVAAGELP